MQANLSILSMLLCANCLTGTMWTDSSIALHQNRPSNGTKTRLASADQREIFLIPEVGMPESLLCGSFYEGRRGPVSRVDRSTLVLRDYDCAVTHPSVPLPHLAELSGYIYFTPLHVVVDAPGQRQNIEFFKGITFSGKPAVGQDALREVYAQMHGDKVSAVWRGSATQYVLRGIGGYYLIDAASGQLEFTELPPATPGYVESVFFSSANKLFVLSGSPDSTPRLHLYESTLKCPRAAPNAEDPCLVQIVSSHILTTRYSNIPLLVLATPLTVVYDALYIPVVLPCVVLPVVLITCLLDEGCHLFSTGKVARPTAPNSR